MLRFIGGMLYTLIKFIGAAVVIVASYLIGHSYGGPIVGGFALIFCARAYVVCICMIERREVGNIESPYPVVFHRHWWW